jgi:multidrug efflux pump subunit AcrB
VVELASATGPSEINRLNRHCEVTIFANVLPGAGQSAVTTAIETAIGRRARRTFVATKRQQSNGRARQASCQATGLLPEYGACLH